MVGACRGIFVRIAYGLPFYPEEKGFPPVGSPEKASLVAAALSVQSIHSAWQHEHVGHAECKKAIDALFQAGKNWARYPARFSGSWLKVLTMMPSLFTMT